MDEVVATFEIRCRRLIDEAGRPLGPLPPTATDQALITRLLEGMLLARAFDRRCVNLQRTGQLGTFATSLGQEAVPVGVAVAMHADDVLVPSYREGAAQIIRGVAIEELLAYWGGDERGHAYANPAVAEDLPVAITVGNQALHAAGVAAAMQHRRQARCAVCVMGDGATSKGDVYEAINVAGAWRLPVVFVVTNNRWAISTPVARQTGAETLAQKGLAGGIAALQADGNDVLAVHDAVGEAVERARSGGGATLVECLTYRVNDHNTADDAGRYRDPAEVEEARRADPIARLIAFSGIDPAPLEAAVGERIEAAVARYLAIVPEPSAAMFGHLHHEIPEPTRWQLRG